MDDASLMTAEQFASRDIDFPQGGRWLELASGRLVTLEPPDQLHGCAVLNLSRALARYLQTSRKVPPGYACYELGLVVARNPDTVRCPAVSYFSGASLFSQVDRTVTEEPPSLVVEVASTNDRRRGLADRIPTYLEWGVEAVWVIDPIDRQVTICEQGRRARSIAEADRLTGGSLLSGFAMPVAELFVQPE